jgi:hypothetical protein
MVRTADGFFCKNSSAGQPGHNVAFFIKAGRWDVSDALALLVDKFKQEKGIE